MTILFDLDGTVIDSTEAILESFAVSLKKYQFGDVDESKIKNLIGYPLSIMFEELGVEKEKINDFVLEYKKHYRIIANEKTILLPMAKEAIELAFSFATLGVVTTKTASYSKDILNNLQIGHYFKDIVGFEDVSNHKPHPEPIEKAVTNLKADKSKTWMIGDTKMDIISAKSANVNYIAVSSGYEDVNSLLEHSNIIKSNIYEAVEFLKNNHK
ncbi:MAG: phosphoglycolate phosphatase [Campylobacterota bacterium]|nr:phosphoglycolate phosphatase [Campylobacterota bacterium]